MEVKEILARTQGALEKIATEFAEADSLATSWGRAVAEIEKWGASFGQTVEEIAGTLLLWLFATLIDQDGNFLDAQKSRFVMTSSLRDLISEGLGLDSLLENPVSVCRMVKRYQQVLADIGRVSTVFPEAQRFQLLAMNIAIMEEYEELARNWDAAAARNEVFSVYDFKTHKVEGVIRSEWEAAMEERILAGLELEVPLAVADEAREVYDATVENYRSLQVLVLFTQFAQLNSLTLMEQLVEFGNEYAVPLPQDWIDENQSTPTSSSV